MSLFFSKQRQEFSESLREHYARYGRHNLPWRVPEKNGTYDPYKILVSELMLQQTQVSRVIPKYQSFLQGFPSVTSLAEAELSAVLRQWKGLGYYRRAKFLWQASQQIDKRQTFPDTVEGLTSLSGVGINTAGAIMVYTWNKPIVFVETNIRTVIFHHFFADEEGVADASIRELLAKLLGPSKDLELSYREFYWAMMDYGSWLKTQVRNNSQSRHYAKQSKFEGSNRQIRGQVLQVLADSHKTITELRHLIDDARLGPVLDALVKEGMIQKERKIYFL